MKSKYITGYQDKSIKRKVSIQVTNKSIKRNSVKKKPQMPF